MARTHIAITADRRLALMKVPYEVVRRWTVLATDPADALAQAKPREHQEFSVHRLPCADWPAPCSHDPEHMRPQC